MNSIIYTLGNITKLHNTVSNNKLWLPALEWTLKIGHYQLLRKKIAYELNTACKFEAKHMEAALQTLNTYVKKINSKFSFSSHTRSLQSYLVRDSEKR